jgi:hypothetical protein
VRGSVDWVVNGDEMRARKKDEVERRHTLSGVPHEESVFGTCLIILFCCLK